MLEFKNLTCKYGKKTILEDLNFTLQNGEIISILGANGSGKSTLLKALMGLISFDGEILYEDINLAKLKIKERAKILSYVPQNTNIPFEFDVFDVVLMGRFHSSSFGVDYTNDDKEKAKEALNRVGAYKFIDRTYKHLSGGERQLILLARALAQQSKIIVLDEPVTGLDLKNQLRLLDLLVELREASHTIIQTTHYPDHALRVSNTVVWLDNQKLYAKGEAKEVITKDRIKEVYGVLSDFIDYKDGYRYILPIKLIKEDL
ncbi:MAG: ABC transporter ATP-binding protein [Campylobacteraceae bacterium]